MQQFQRRALVAGGAGFLGSHLCDVLLAQGMAVTCLDNLMTGSRRNIARHLDDSAFLFVEADVVDPLPRAITSAVFDEVYNLACPASPPAYQRNPVHTLLTSVVGTRQLLQVAQRCDARFLLTSTSEVYGDPLEHPQRESYRGNVNPIGPRACYDEGKRAAETLAFDYHRSGCATVRVARIFNTYGPRLDPEDGRVVSNLIRQALGGEPLTVYGRGAQTRSFCYVDDMIAGLVALMRHQGPQPGPVNLGNPLEITVLALARRIAALTGQAAAIRHLPLPVDDPQRRRPDIAKAIETLGWMPATPLDEGLRATIDWFAQDRVAIAPAPVPAARPIPAALAQ